MVFIPDSQVNDSDFSLPPVGWNKVEIIEAERKTSQKGHPMFNVKLADPQNKQVLGWDTFMLAGAGNGIGIRKMATLGIAQKVDGGYELPDNAGELVGCRGWAYFAHEKYEDKDGQPKTRAKVDINFGGKGYLHEDDVPPSSEMPTAADADPDDPFSEYAGADAATSADDDDIPW